MDDRIAEMLEIWEASAIKPTPQQLCGDNVELLPELHRAIAALAAADSALASEWEDATAEDAIVAQRIAGYDIKRILGQGGMGMVYEAEQPSPRRLVALKVIRAGLASKTMLRRFEMEKEVLGRLEHPGIARIYDAGTADAGQGPQPYFAMERVHGLPLVRYAEEAAMDLRARVELLAKVCDAVLHAHQKGVVHRDLKPANILVAPDGQPKVLDFGVARVTDADATAITVDTQTGQIVGTLQYMSPEQASGNAGTVDTRSDIYALGLIAYELLSGQRPYDLANKTLPEALRVIQEEEPTRLGSHARSLRGDIETIVGKTIEKDRNRRYSSVADLSADLRRFLNYEPISARPPGTWYQLSRFARRNRALVVGVTAVFVALVFGIMATTYEMLLARRATAAAVVNERSALRSQIQSNVIAGLSADENQREDAALLWFAQAASAAGPFPDLYNANLVRLRFWSRRAWMPFAALPRGKADVTQLQFHPSNQYVLTVDRDGNCGLWNIRTEKSVSFPVSGSDLTAAMWNPDGTQIAVAEKNNGVSIWSFPSFKPIAHLSSGGVCRYLAWSPDSRCLIAAGELTRLWDLNRPGGPVDLPNCANAWFAQFDDTTGSRLVVATDNQQVNVFRVTPDPRELKVQQASEPRRHDRRPRCDPPRIIHNGRQLATLQGDSVFISSLDETEPAIVLTKDAINDFSVSADGRFVAIGHFRSLDVHQTSDGAKVASFSGANRLCGEISPGGTALLRMDEQQLATFGTLQGDPLSETSRAHAAAVLNGWISPYGQLIATGDEGGSVRFWRTPQVRGETSLPLDGFHSLVKLDPSGTLLIPCGCTYDGARLLSTRVYDVRSGAMVGQVLDPRVISADCGPIQDAAFSPDRTIVALIAGKTLQFWDWRKGIAIGKSITLPSKGRSVAFDPTSAARAAVLCVDGQVLLVDPRSGRSRDLYTHDGQLHTQFYKYNGVACFSADGRMLMTCGGTKLAIWDVARDRLAFVNAYPGFVHDAKFSNDASVVSAALSDHTVRVVESISGKQLSILPHPDQVYSAKFNSDHSRLLTACRDGVARLWDWKTIKVLRSFQRAGEMFDADFGPHEQWIITASNDGVGRIWDAETGLAVSPRIRLPGRVLDVVLTPDKQFAAFGCQGSSVKIVSLDPLEHPLQNTQQNVRLESEVLTQYFLDNNLQLNVQSSDQWLQHWRQLGGRDGLAALTEIAGASSPAAKVSIEDRPTVPLTPQALLPLPTPPAAPAAPDHPLPATTFVEDLGNGVSLKLIRIELGEFDMGSPENEVGHAGEEILHHVWLPQPFYMGIYTVTQKQYEAVTGRNPSFFKGDDLPVEGVSWEDATAFCEMLRAKTGRPYRLPTEAEWEYACRAGTKTAFSAGNDENALSKVGWYEDNSDHKTHSVGTKQPNGWGLYDMHGNVKQWCSDAYGPYIAGDAVDPTGPTPGGITAGWHMERGGAWGSKPPTCRAASRFHAPSNYHTDHIGIRLVVDASMLARRIDLLKLVVAEKDVLRGTWGWDGNVVLFQKPVNGGAVVEFPYKAPTEYDFTVIFSEAAPDFTAQICPLPGRRFLWYMAGDQNRAFGFQRPAIVEGDPSVLRSLRLVPGQRHTSILRVRRDRVSAFLDGRLIASFKTDQQTIVDAAWALRTAGTLGFGTYGTTARIEAAEVAEVSDHGHLLRPATKPN